MNHVIKIPMKLISSTLLATAMMACPLIGNDKVVAASKKVLGEASGVDLLFHGGFSGAAVPQSVALLYLLGEPNIVPFFEKLTEIKGAPSIYGLIGLRHINPKSETYQKCLKKVIARDGESEIETAIGDVIGKDKVSDLVLSPDDAEKRKLKFGEYFSEAFANIPANRILHIVDNGVLGEDILNPFKHMDIDPRTRPDLSDLERRQVKIAKMIVSRKLLHRHPREVLRLYGFEKDDDILDCFKRGVE